MTKKKFYRTITIVFCLVMALSFAACSGNDEKATGDANKVMCQNGNMVGVEKNGVYSFKGIPFAKDPVGELRWKAPVKPENSDEDFDAAEYGHSAIQTEYEEDGEIIMPESNQGEDCLSLNVWTASPNSREKKPVMVYIHGGAFGWEGSSEPTYDGTNFAEKNQDVVLVTINYRLGMMGFIDFTKVKGGEDYKDSVNLGILDMIAALEWVNENIEGFGGDPENITVFGESAGAVAVSVLLTSDKSQGLFQKAIQQSPSINVTNYIANFGTREKSQEVSKQLMKATGAKTMEDLLAIPGEELIVLERDNCFADYAGGPLIDGDLIKEDPITAYSKGAGKDVDLLIGSNADEFNYQIYEWGTKDFKKMVNERFDATYKIVDDKDRKVIDTMLEYTNPIKPELFWKKADLLTESYYLMPTVLEASYHADNGGKTYMYHWTYPGEEDYGACHAVELCHVFHNFDAIFLGEKPNEELSAKVMEAWTNFAKTGDPSISDIKWPEFDSKKMNTMIIDAGKWEVVSDPQSDLRKSMMKLINKYGHDFAFVKDQKFIDTDIKPIKE